MRFLDKLTMGDDKAVEWADVTLPLESVKELRSYHLGTGRERVMLPL